MTALGGFLDHVGEYGHVAESDDDRDPRGQFLAAAASAAAQSGRSARPQVCDASSAFQRCPAR